MRQILTKYEERNKRLTFYNQFDIRDGKVCRSPSESTQVLIDTVQFAPSADLIDDGCVLVIVGFFPIFEHLHTFVAGLPSECKILRMWPVVNTFQKEFFSLCKNPWSLSCELFYYKLLSQFIN